LGAEVECAWERRSGREPVRWSSRSGHSVRLLWRSSWQGEPEPTWVTWEGEERPVSSDVALRWRAP